MIIYYNGQSGITHVEYAAMLPLINTTLTPITPQPSLVATPVPDNNTLRVSPTAVAPSVSSAQTDPNASGNNKLLLQGGAGSTQPVASMAQSLVTNVTNLSPETPLGAPATLLAQMIGQNLPPEAETVLRGVLNEYEKIIINSYVKYMPSTASLPQAEPSGTFSQTLKQLSSAPQEKPAQTRSTTAAANTSAATDESAIEEAFPKQAAQAANTKPAYAAINAYNAATARLAAPTKASVKEAEPASE